MTHNTSITEEALRGLESEIRPFTGAFDLIPEHVVITDADGTILYANEAVATHTGFSHDETIGKNPRDLWGGLMPEEFYERMWRIIKTEKKPFRGEVENRTKDGIRYWQELRVYPIFDSAGEVRFFIGMEPDITVRKVREGHREQYVEELERLTKYLEEKQATMEDFAVEAAHMSRILEGK